MIPALERVAGITASEISIECPHCKVSQKVHVAVRAGQKERQYMSCINCQSEFDVKAGKIVGGPFIA